MSLDQGTGWEVSKRLDVDASLAEAISVTPSASGTSGVHFELNGAAQVAVSIFDVSGRRLRDLANCELAAGPHDLSWDGRDQAGRETPAGLYFVRVQTGGQTATAKLIRLQ